MKQHECVNPVIIIPRLELAMLSGDSFASQQIVDELGTCIACLRWIVGALVIRSATYRVQFAQADPARDPGVLALDAATKAVLSELARYVMTEGS